MIGAFRSFLNTWAARAFFVVLVGVFVLWGVADVIRNIGHSDAVATVGDRKIEAPEFQEAFRTQMNQLVRMLGGRTEPTPAQRRAVAQQTLERLVVQAAIADEVNRLGIAVPDAALRQAVFEMPAFRGPGGSFDRNQFEAVLRNNNFTEGRFLEVMRADLASRQLLETVQAGVAAPEELVRQAYAFQRETRIADVVELPFSAAPESPAPSDDELRRTYENDPDRYRTPEYRRIKAVILAPDLLARDIPVSDDDIRAYYDAHKAEYVTPEKRSAQVLVTPDPAVAEKLADQWKSGADWATMQKAAADAGASAVALDDSVRTEFPATELADAVFAATPDTVVGPIKSALGNQVLEVTKVTPGTNGSLDQLKDEIHAKVARDKAIDLVYTRANKLEDALSAGNGLDDMPGDLGLAGVAGTLDAKGTTPQGQPAPIPGTPALRQAIIDAAFAATKGEAPRMQEGPDQSYYAVAVEDITPPALEPFEEVQDQVREEWEQDQRRHAQEKVAAKLLSAAQTGSLDDAATVAGLRTEKTPPVARGTPTQGVAPQLSQVLFGLKQGEATMVETPEGFLVAKLDSITDPDPSSDPAGAAALRDELNRSLTQDVAIVFGTALRDREHPTVNRTLLDSFSE